MSMEPLLRLYRKNWYSSEDISVIGWVEFSGKVYEGEALLLLVQDYLQTGLMDEIDRISIWAKSLNGTFAIVVRCKDQLVLIADHVRSYPLVYSCREGQVIVSDHLLQCAKDLQLTLDPDIDKCEFFLTSGLVLGEHTVFKEWYAVQAAEVVVLTADNRDRKRYLTYRLNLSEGIELDIADEVRKQNLIYKEAFDRMIKSAPQVHNWVLPLSGGHDSRMVLYRLYRAGIKNVICYTYGFPGNEQSRISKQLADQLGYPWYFVEYTAEKWEQLRNSRDFSAYFDFAFNGVSDPHLQDFLAVSELKTQNILHDNDVFVPGHTFDFLTGAYCWDGLENMDSFEDLCYYLRNYMDQWPCKKRTSTVYKELGRFWLESKLPFNQFTEYFFWQERHAKFIQNSLRVYEYFGFDWRTPLWDRSIMDYWQSIPLKDKLYRGFLYACEKKGLYEGAILSVPFDMEMVSGPSWKKTLLAGLPDFIVRRLKFHLKKDEMVNDPLSTIYQSGMLKMDNLVSYRQLPEALRYYLSPYRKRPLCQNPDNDVNSLFALRNIFR